jgi:hypothetical protein
MLPASSFLQHIGYSSWDLGSHNYVLDGLIKVHITQDKMELHMLDVKNICM